MKYLKNRKGLDYKMKDYNTYLFENNREKEKTMETFIWNVGRFLRKIVLDKHEVFINPYSSDGVKIATIHEKGNNSKIYFLVNNRVNILYGRGGSKDYPHLLKYIVYKLDDVFVAGSKDEENLSNVFWDYSTQFYGSFKDIDKVKFSTEEYEIFEDTERFGL